MNNKYTKSRIKQCQNQDLSADLPVKVIRPTIDGRRGPLKGREGLEVQTFSAPTSEKMENLKTVFR